MKWFLRIGATVLFSLLLAGLAGADQPRKFKTGARRSPAHKILAAPRFQRVKAPPAQTAYVPKQLDMWGNDQFGDCVSAEEAFAKACYSPEIFIDAATVVAWAQANGYRDGADLSSVLQSMQSGGFKVGQQLYNDGGPSTVDYTQESILQAAIAQGPVKIAIDSSALPKTAGNQQGWYAFGGTPGQFTNTDHCVSVAGYGPTAWLAQQLGVATPPGAPTNGYLVFTWSTIGIVDFAWLQGTCVEAWVRSPTTVGVPPLTPGPPPPPPPPPPSSGVTITLAGTNTSADGVYVPQGAVTGLTPDKFKAMTGQQLLDWLNTQNKTAPKPPAPPPARPQPGDINLRVLDLLRRIDSRLESVENRVRALEASPGSRSISIPRPSSPDFQRILDESERKTPNQRKGVMRSDRPDSRRGGTVPVPLQNTDFRRIASVSKGTAATYVQTYRRALPCRG